MRFATEDVGLADPYALVLTTRCYQACKELGSPLCNPLLVQCVSYLSLTAKSNELYLAFGNITNLIHESGNLPVPMNEQQQQPISYLPEDLRGKKLVDVQRAISDLRNISIKRMMEEEPLMNSRKEEMDANLVDLPLEKRVKLYTNDKNDNNLPVCFECKLTLL